MKYSEIKALIKQLHAAGWEKRKGLNDYIKTWDLDGTRFGRKYRMVLRNDEITNPSFPLDKMLHYFEVKVKQMVDKMHRDTFYANGVNLHIFLRNIRVDQGELLKDMADKLGMSSSRLSAIEHGKEVMPEGFIEKVKSLYPHLSHNYFLNRREW